MGNEKKSMIVMMAVTVIAVTVCVATILLMKKEKETPSTTKKIITEPEKVIPKKIEKKKIIPKKTVISTPSVTEEKKANEKEEWKEAGKELADFLQNSKFKDLIVKSMTARNKAYLKDLFDKYGIDKETQDAIAAVISESQSQFFSMMMSAGGMQGKLDDQTREKLIAMNKETEDQIANLASAAFLEDAKDKRSNELKNNYLNRIDRGLKGDNKMSNEQRAAMDALYSENQMTEIEMLTLPKDEIKQRQDSINNGAKEILSEKQYKSYKKTSSNPFRMTGMRLGGVRGRTR
jgi:hypothetical protein